MAVQIICYINMIRVDFPASLEIYLKALKKIAEFDVLPTEEIKTWLIKNDYLDSKETKDNSKENQVAIQ